MKTKFGFGKPVDAKFDDTVEAVTAELKRQAAEGACCTLAIARRGGLLRLLLHQFGKSLRWNAVPRCLLIGIGETKQQAL